MFAQDRFTNEALDRRQAETIFREHLSSLQKRLIDGYLALLEEVVSAAQRSAAWTCLIEHHVHSPPSLATTLWDSVVALLGP
jgi:hypothetical protein